MKDDNVRLRPLERDDASLIVTWRSRPEVAVQLFGAPPTLEEQRHWQEQVLALDDREEYVICWGRQADLPVGTIGLSAISRRHRRAEYGILLGEPHARGRGVARAASQLILERAFQLLDLERVYLHAFADNARAVELYEHLGFVSEGMLRKHARRGTEAHDVIVMGLLRPEWAARQTSGG